MHVSCCFQDQAYAEQWVQALREHMPQAKTIERWRPGSRLADYAIAWYPSQQFFDEQPQLKALFVAGAGVDAVWPLHRPSGCRLIRIEDAGMGQQMAQYAAYGALRFARGFDRYEELARKRVWQDLELDDLTRFPVGVMGLGVLGRPVALALQQLGFTVHAWVNTPRSDPSIPVYAGQNQFNSFLAATRILICVLPLTEATRHIIDASALQRLLPGAYLINLARGGHLDEEALLEALGTGHVSGALLDVCSVEPAPAAHPFWNHPKISLTPHIAASTLVVPSAKQVALKIHLLEGQQPVSGEIGARGY